MSYIETALWSSLDDNGAPLDKNYGPDNIHPDTLSKMEADLERFLDLAGDLISEDNLLIRGEVDDQAEHDFWLTRNGHGAGFWDGSWEDETGRRLTEISKSFGEFYLYVGDDGMIHGM